MKTTTPLRPLPTTASVASLCLLLVGICNADVTPTLPPPTQKEGVTFDRDIQPLLARSCTKCHGEEKQKAKLRLDTRQDALRGAADEKVILPGNSAESLLVKAISKATKEKDEWMPPAGKAQELSPAEIGLVRAWIDQGAK
ncbi:MAG: hypothetical protein MUE94_09815 [Verrucomicrobia bacterium]|nr:hypothetical protein [Verrucomicrobiota bacterium]